jgi:hypothetical protein
MKNAVQKLLFVATLALVSLSPSAFADSAVVVDGSYAFANNGYGIPPYGGTLNGQAASFYCVDFAHDIVGGDSWSAIATSVTPDGSYGSTYQKNGTEYLEFAWLLTQMTDTTDQTQQAAYQWAIWSLTGGVDPFTGSDSASNLLGEAYWAVTHGYSGQGWEILTPGPGQYGQEFMVQTPEPSSLLLLALGLGGLLFLKRREQLSS